MPSIFWSAPDPFLAKQLLNIMPPPPCFTVGVIWMESLAPFPPHIGLIIVVKQLNFCLIWPWYSPQKSRSLSWWSSANFILAIDACLGVGASSVHNSLSGLGDVGLSQSGFRHTGTVCFQILHQLLCCLWVQLNLLDQGSFSPRGQFYPSSWTFQCLCGFARKHMGPSVVRKLLLYRNQTCGGPQFLFWYFYWYC